ncbi:ATP synthase F1 subunit delta [Heliophilum fasciatum]|uniref:ATP synthase subunit delta n=1 Tax=Heliophilum fasciatum TaxID=35700 RepID=A0A4R2RML0_9FIRM|nr:ATP synthase F1 subunit delta [Heliophilum fasciatum]MCW2277477.1 F-type H+-transporting ATPase subunit delta [Heliophilum fasciatum]TCP65232.1 ATP synthase F1 subcomplex delta subunit [Heliophilum fasciatum]
MLTGAVARRYAQALLDIGVENKALDQLEKELGSFVALLEENAELKRVLFHPSIIVAEKKALVEKLLAQAQFSATARAFILLVIDRRRETYFADIYREYVLLANQVRNIAHVNITSAVALSDGQVTKLKEQLASATGKTVVLQQKVDASLLGGMIIAIGDLIIDGSIAGKLRDLKATLQRAPLPTAN